jgi:uncharacterized protein YegL
MRNVIPAIRQISMESADVQITIACLSFSSGCEWRYPAPVPAEDFTWNDLEAWGATDLGAACRELAAKLHRGQFMKDVPGGWSAPVLLLFSDGETNDDFAGGLAELQQNKWYQHAVKAALAIGDAADSNALAEFTGTSEAVLKVDTPEALRDMIRFVSLGSVNTAFMGRPAEYSRQDALNGMIKVQKQTGHISDRDAAGRGGPFIGEMKG